MKIVWTPTAKNQIISISYYIARDNYFAATKVVNTIISKTTNLSQFPNMGKIVPELSTHKIRELPCLSYRIYYRQVRNAIIIMSVRHGKQKNSKQTIIQSMNFDG